MRLRSLLCSGLLTVLALAVLPAAHAQYYNNYNYTDYSTYTPNPSGIYFNHPLSNFWALNLFNCGDGRRQYYEQCDDGNRVNGDGCNRSCRLEQVKRVYGCMNGRYLPGDTYPAQDGCNTCTCQRNGVSSCTKMACPTPRDRCTSSSQCGSDEVCSTQYGDCQPSCAPGSEFCTMVCAGKCIPKPETPRRTCQPYVCADGTTFPACNASGTPIYYFAAPCLTHGGEVDGFCGNGLCEKGEANSCPSCVYSFPACKAPCKVGTCPQDCR